MVLQIGCQPAPSGWVQISSRKAFSRTAERDLWDAVAGQVAGLAASACQEGTSGVTVRQASW